MPTVPRYVMLMSGNVQATKMRAIFDALPKPNQMTKRGKKVTFGAGSQIETRGSRNQRTAFTLPIAAPRGTPTRTAIERPVRARNMESAMSMGSWPEAVSTHACWPMDTQEGRKNSGTSFSWLAASHARRKNSTEPYRRARVIPLLRRPPTPGLPAAR